MHLKLIYGNIPFWRAEMSRLALFLGEIEFEDHRISREELQEMKRTGTLPFGQIPVLEVDGKTIAQTGAIGRFCGKLSGLYPSNHDFDAAKVDEIIDAATDITGCISPSMREKGPDKKAAMRSKLANETLPKWFGFLENVLKQNGETGYFVGASLTIADLAIWRLLGWLTGGKLDGIPKEIIEPFTLLKSHYTTIDNHEKIRAWMDSHYS